MYNEYFPPYKAAVDAGVGSVMASFNEVDGVPATASKWLMTDVLRKQWGFGGFVVTDYTGIEELQYHGIGDLKEVSARALAAGIDMDMVSEGFLTTTEKSLNEKKINMVQLDAAVRRILEAKYKLGLFEDPYRYCNSTRSKTEVYTDANRRVARTIASESLVLMKNENNLLPLKRGTKILLTGPLADNAENMPGTWSVAALFDKAIPVLRGLKEVGGSSTSITFVRGSNLDYDPVFEERAGMFGKDLRRDMRPPAEIIAEAVAAAKDVDVIVAAIGESAEMSGECSSRSNLEIPKAQRDLLMELKKTGKPIVLVLFTGRPLTIGWEKENIPAILNVWFPGSEAGYAIADVLFGDVNPSGKLTTTFPQNIGQVPLFYNHKNTGRPLKEGKWFEKFKSNYLDVTNDPLFHFGYGLSYAKFYYGNVKVSATELKGNAKLTVTVPVTNNSKVAGKEVVQLYLRDVVGSTTRPVKELKNFEKVLIQPGETKEVTFTITPEDLKFYNYDLKFDWESGDFDVMVGPNSAEVQITRVNWMK
jgi:beta-glucosidase